MTEAVKVALIMATPATLIGLAGLLVSVRNGKKSEAILIQVDGNLSVAKNEIAEVKERLATASGALQRSEGKAEGIAEARKDKK